MMKKRRMILVLLCVLSLLASAGSTAEPDVRTARGFIGRIEQGSIAMMGEMSLIPYDCSGFEVRYLAELRGELPDEMDSFLPAAEADGSSGTVRCPLDEETARRLLENSYAVSIGPDGSTLWTLSLFSSPVMFIQRNKTLTLMAQSSGRGVPDTEGSLKAALDRKLRISQEPVEGEVRWSPDSRYLFFNDTDRWRGAQMMLDDPYLADTQTGEVFLLESGGYPKDPLQGTFRCVMNGRFSMDGKSFYWYCRSYTAGTASHSLVRYDLESGRQETVCELKGALKDFCEVKENCWFLLEAAGSGSTLIRMTVSPNGINRTEETIPVSWDSCSFFPAVRGNVLLAATVLSSGGTYLLPLTWDMPAASSVWRKIGSIHDERLREITVEEMEAEIREARNNSTVLSGSASVGTAYIKHAAAVIGMTNLLLTAFIREPVPNSWGGGFSDFNGQILLNTEDLRIFPIQTAFAPDGLQDSLIDGNRFLMKNYGQDALGLYSAYTLPETTFVKGELYSSPYGVFMCRNESDPLVLSSVTLENRELSAEITAAEGGYSIRFRVVDYPEPETVRREFSVPEVLNEARWKEITAAMSKKDVKKFANMYMKVTPDKLAERADEDEIRTSYPAAASEMLYILKDGIKAANLETAETLLAKAGYTPEDYARDMELAAVPRETNVVVTKSGSSRSFPVRYVFSEYPTVPESSRAEELAGLCDRIGSAVMANRGSAEPLPVEAVIRDRYDMGSVGFHVAVDDSEETENTLEFTLTVTP